jgi:transcriptional regulator with XRE-family HTH domain
MTGAELREQRKSLNLTQEELGEILGITSNTIARWERDEMAVPPFLHLALKQIKPKRPAKKAK